MPPLRGLVITLLAVALVAMASPAWAYDEIPPTNPNCIDCHGYEQPTTTYETFGPHSGYLTTTNKCQACHTVHNAPAGGILLLPAATIKGTCETCHDGTGGGGVYGVLAARVPAVTVAADHSIDQTNVVPGGDASGGDSTGDFSGSSDFLTCTDCHAPHGANVVAAFTGDRARSSSYMALGPTVVSSRLLKQRPTSYTGIDPITEYGSDWCGACHVGRLSGSGMANNHPVESSVNPPSAGSVFIYRNVALFGGGTGPMGKSNLGYKMADPRVGEQVGHDPICQQCHEDARDPDLAFSITAVDGETVTDNPRFQTFPHESQIASFLIEDGASDGFCLNCHSPSVLP